MQEYAENHQYYDDYINYMYSADRVYFTSMTVENALTMFKERVLDFLITNRYKYSTLFATMNFEYNPIENYNRVEDSANTRTPNLTRNNTRTPNLSTVIDTTLTNGERVSNSTAKQDVSPFDVQNDYTTFDKNVVESAVNQSIDKNNSKTVETGTDTTVTNDTGEEKVVIHSKISGNIGVTTSQQMIASEREVADFSFYKMLFSDIINYICITLY